MAQYPTSASTDSTLYIQVNNKTTNLTAGVSNSDTTIPVSSTTGFPATGTVTVDLEIISYTSVDATNFLGATRGFDGTTAVAHLSGALASHNIIARHHNNLKDEVIAIETDLVGVNSALTPTAPTSTSTSILNRFNQIAQRFKDLTGLTNWYDAFTFFPISKGGTNSGTALTNDKVIHSSGGAIVESTVTSTELGYLSGVTSAIQTQIDGTVKTTGNQSVAGTKTFTDPIVQNDTTNQLVLGVTNTTTISATAPSTSRTVTIPDPGANASFVMTEGTQTINGSKTLGANLAMGTNKLTGLGAGTANGDSVRYEQLHYTQAPVQATITTTTSTTSTTFVTANLSASITPTSTSHKIKVTITGVIAIGNIQRQCYLTAFRNSTDLSNGVGFVAVGNSGTTTPLAVPASITYIDSPTTTSSTTYAAYIRTSNAASTATFNEILGTAVITLEEVI